MNEQQIRQFIKQEIQATQAANRFQLTGIQRHIHNGVDSPSVLAPTITFAGRFLSVVGVVFYSDPFPKGWTVDHATQTIVFTSTFAGGETSGTLTSAWSSLIQTPTTVQITFSNSDVRVGTFTTGSTAVTWTVALSGAATATATTVATGTYIVIHNLNSNFYVATVNTQTVVAGRCASVEFRPNYMTVTVFASDTKALIDSPVCFLLTTVLNKSTTLPTYRPAVN